MNELARAKQQYFRLMRLVSKDNELYFLVNENKLFAIIGLNQRVVLCSKQKRRWVATSGTQFFELEEFLSDFMNQQSQIDSKLTEKIRLALFGLSS